MAWEFAATNEPDYHSFIAFYGEFLVLKFVLMLTLAVSALPTFAARSITAEQLEQLLIAVHDRPDKQVAQKLTEVHLTERLSPARLARCEAQIIGSKSRQQLIVLADAAAFFDLPAAEIPATVAPSFTDQNQMMKLIVNYVSKTVHLLPDLSATRVTTSYTDSPPVYTKTGIASIDRYIPLYELGPMRILSTSSATVLYRDGREIVDSGGKASKPDPNANWMDTTGEFSSILITVVVDAAQGKFSWSHWEQGSAGPLAIFRYLVPEEKSHYLVTYNVNGNLVLKRLSGYHGQITVDPESGAILRMTLETDLKPDDPIIRSGMLVEYGPVEIGGKTYTCLVKSVSILQQRKTLYTILNDVSFERYHLFRAETRILTEDH
jgi:hypothetical protein